MRLALFISSFAFGAAATGRRASSSLRSIRLSTLSRVLRFAGHLRRYACAKFVVAAWVPNASSVRSELMLGCVHIGLSIVAATKFAGFRKTVQDHCRRRATRTDKPIRDRSLRVSKVCVSSTSLISARAMRPPCAINMINAGRLTGLGVISVHKNGFQGFGRLRENATGGDDLGELTASPLEIGALPTCVNFGGLFAEIASGRKIASNSNELPCQKAKGQPFAATRGDSVMGTAAIRMENNDEP